LSARRIAVAALGAGALLSGCGTSDDARQARDVVERFYAAIEADRPEEACGQLSQDAIKQLESQTEQSCRGVITRLEYEPAAIRRAQVFITNAKVDLESGESAFLDREPEGWRLTAIGCKPEEGKPRDRPFDCELEA
jgi:hypothetical protein